MNSRLLHEAEGQKTFVLVFDTGNEVMAHLMAFARDHHLAGSRFTAIGAFKEATLGYFDWTKKDYKKIPVTEQVEVVSLIGDITQDELGEQRIHAHAVLGKSDGAALAGHLLEGHVRPTLELMLVETPEHLHRHYDAETGLALIEV